MNVQISEWEAFEKAHPIVVKTKLTAPHPIIWNTAERIGFAFDPTTCVPPPDGRWFDLDVSPKHAQRALCIADALVKACELRGFELHPVAGERSDRGIVVIIDGHPVPVSFVEQGHPSACLLLNTSYRTWNDRLSRPLSRRLNSVILTFRKFVAASQERDRYDRHIAELHSARDELRAQVQEERKAVETLNSEVANWEWAQSIRAYITAVEATPAGRGKRKERAAWVAWARAQADRIDPLCASPASVLDLPRWRYRELDYWEVLNEEGIIELG